MSVQISACRVSKAYEDDEAMKSLAEDFFNNLTKGHFSTSPCQHEPKCR